MLTVITGTGRCGTRWLASTLQAAGINATHEKVFRPDRKVGRRHVRVDVSWLALTHPHSHPTMLMAREPRGCIASLIDCGLFTDGDRYTRAVARCIPLTGDAFTDACAWWCWANTRPAKVRWRIDQPDRLPAALRKVGLDPDGVDPHRPPDIHRIGNRSTLLTWDDLPDTVHRVAASWGWA